MYKFFLFVCLLISVTLLVGCRSSSQKDNATGTAIVEGKPSITPASAGEKSTPPTSAVVSETLAPAAASLTTPTPTILPAVAITPQPTPIGQKGSWSLVFADEFAETSLDTSKWVTCYWWDDNGCTNKNTGELQWYQPGNVSVRDGSLRFQAKQEKVNASDGRAYGYTSGIVTTGRLGEDVTVPAKFAFKYGYAEIRAKPPQGKGFWPAFWLLPADNTSKPEIDVMEVLGHRTNTVEMHYHFSDETETTNHPGFEFIGPDFSSDWHTYAVDWQPDLITWYVDGVQRWQFTSPEYIADSPMTLLLNLAVGGVYPGDPDASTVFPGEFLVDYIRVWHRVDMVYLLPTEDSYVDESDPTANFGQSETLYSDGVPVKRAYLKFDTSGLSSNAITSAWLRIHLINRKGSESPYIHLVDLIDDNSWSESTITFENSPKNSNLLLGSLDSGSYYKVYDIPLDVARLQPKIGSILTLVVNSDGEDGLYFYSKDTRFGRPQLIIATSGNTP